MRFLVFTLALLIFVGSIAFATVAGVYAYYARELPDYTALDRRQVFQTARILDREGQLLDEINDPVGGRRTLIPLAEMPRSLRDATIAAEDASFYANPGFDPRAILRALYQNVTGQRIVSGASTITQQLVKNALLTPELTGERKIKEAFLAIELTRRYSKDRILEMYLNEIYYGNLSYGVEAAAQTYFGKSARQLSLAESAFLAGLPQAPATYDPYVNYASAQERQRYVLDQMEQRGLATPAELAQARSSPLTLRPGQAGGRIPAPHFTAFVRQWLEQRFSTDLLFRGGLQVQTTLDLRLQLMAERAARERIAALRERNASNAALVALKPDSGEILAMLGSLDFYDQGGGGQVNVALRPRQPGSTLKPFTYLAAFERGWSPASMIMDIPANFSGYSPRNFDNQYRGPVRARAALAQSLNVPAVRVLEAVGVDELINRLHRYGVNGLNDPRRYGLSVTLGGGEVTLLDLTYAYQVLATGGSQVGAAVLEAERRPGYREQEPVAVLRVTDASGRVLYQHQRPAPRQLADPGLTYLITSILSDDEARAPTFGRNSPLNLARPAAVKSGTSDDFRDSWVVGYTPDLLVGVWVGNNDGSPMRDVLGAQGAGRIWGTVMTEALATTPPAAFPRAASVVQREVCALSGLLPSPDCPRRVNELFVQSNLPTRPDDIHRGLEVCKINGKLANEYVPANAREKKTFYVFPEPYRAWAVQNGYPAPPTERCDDVYRGVKRAEINAPPPARPISGTVQIVGTALMDDIHHYDLEVAEGPIPARWNGITMGRQQGVDNALLGVWDTAAVNPGVYTLRLSLFDSLGNSHVGQVQVMVGPNPTPTPAPSATPSPDRNATPSTTRTATPRSVTATPTPPRR